MTVKSTNLFDLTGKVAIVTGGHADDPEGAGVEGAY